MRMALQETDMQLYRELIVLLKGAGNYYSPSLVPIIFWIPASAGMTLDTIMGN